ncbi:MAG: hypothetical protein WCO05_04565 [Candidatus Moraniibacteriota bacterium]
MKKVLEISSVLLGVVFLAGCGQQPVSQTQPTTPAPIAQKPAQVSPDKQLDHKITPEEMKKIVMDETGKSAEQVDLGAKKAGIQSAMHSILGSLIICNDNNKPILSGNGGDKVCERDSAFNSLGSESYTWPTITNICGPNTSDIKWIVKNGSESNWDITINCKGFADCNGPQNAICNANDGCKISGSCK